MTDALDTTSKGILKNKGSSIQRKAKFKGDCKWRIYDNDFAERINAFQIWKDLQKAVKIWLLVHKGVLY